MQIQLQPPLPLVVAVVGSIAMMFLARRTTDQNHPSDFAETPIEGFFLCLLVVRTMFGQ